jgi:hypothetical protein
MTPRVRWWRILIGGVLAEVAVIAVVLLVGHFYGQVGLSYSAPAASFVMCFIAALLVARRLNGGFVLHGVLLGVVATSVYVALTRAHAQPMAYIVAHALKLIGGALGGLVGGRRVNATHAAGAGR